MEASSQESADLVIETGDLLRWLVGGTLTLKAERKLTRCRNINSGWY